MKTHQNINWKSLKPVPDKRLFRARAQLHQSAQLLAAAGISFLQHCPDDSHTAMFWSPENHLLLTQPLLETPLLQVALNPITLEVSILRDHVVVCQIPLQGITLSQAAMKLQSALHKENLSKDKFTMKKHYDLPDYPDYTNEAIDAADTAAFQVIAHSFSNAFTALDGIRLHDPKSSELLIWPHHFDMGLLITVTTDHQNNLSKSIGLGLSPGDGSYAAPYYYVANWPAPSADRLPTELSSKGKWHTENWVGMVLPLKALTSVSTQHAQEQILSDYLSEALSIAKDFSEVK